MKRNLLFALCSLVMLTVFGCGTIKGIGDDISSVGGWVKNSSDTVKNEK